MDIFRCAVRTYGWNSVNEPVPNEFFSKWLVDQSATPAETATSESLAHDWASGSDRARSQAQGSARVAFLP